MRAHPFGAHRTGGGAQGDTPELATENAVLQIKLDAAHQLADDRAATITDLRCRLDQSEEKRAEAEEERASTQRQLTALLTDQRESKTEPQANTTPARLGQINYPLWGLVLAGFGFLIWWMVTQG